MRTTIIKDEINYLVFGEIYHRFDDPGAKRKAFTILEATIECLNKKGFGSVTLEMVAREGGVSRSAIKHYFSDLDDLSGTAIKYIRLRFQKRVVDAVSKHTTPTAMLAQYIDSCFEWVENQRAHANVWLSFLSQCVRRPTLREINTTAVVIGEERIQRLLKLGQEAGAFSFASPEAAAKAVQSLVMGAMITYASENLADPAEYKAIIKRNCLALAGAAA